MVKSMTGFGRAEEIIAGRDIIVEIKSVNHRFFDFSSRITRGYGFLENKLKAYLQHRIDRGKLDVFVSVETLESNDVSVSVNHPLAAEYVRALREVQTKYNLKDDISAGDIARYADIFAVHKAPENEDEIWDAVQSVTEKALESFLSMREAEGAHLQKDVSQRTENILSLVTKIEQRSPQTVAEYQQKLEERLSEMLSDAKIDEQRILTEAAVFADKVSVDEETVRLRSHVAQFADMLKSSEAVGRRLDFIVQEMNREANTIGSKCIDAQISHNVVDMKAEIEKIREQIQNIE